MECPDCGSEEIERIGVYEYQCEVCGEVFDAMEARGRDDNEYPEDWDDDEEDQGW
jgi:uncharacterized Zn finger protein